MRSTKHLIPPRLKSDSYPMGRSRSPASASVPAVSLSGKLEGALKLLARHLMSGATESGRGVRGCNYAILLVAFGKKRRIPRMKKGGIDGGERKPGAPVGYVPGDRAGLLRAEIAVAGKVVQRGVGVGQ